MIMPFDLDLLLVAPKMKSDFSHPSFAGNRRWAACGPNRSSITGSTCYGAARLSGYSACRSIHAAWACTAIPAKQHLGL